MVTFPIKSLQHPIVKELTAIRKSAKRRHQAGEVLVSGYTMVRELGPRLNTLLVIKEEAHLPTVRQTYLVTEEILRKITGLPNPEGCAATLPLPQSTDLSQKKRLLILDNISDPGNLGTLLRTAYALGYEGACLINGVDPFNDKALRAAKGATFHLPLSIGNIDNALPYLSTHQTFAGTLSGKPLSTCKAREPFAVIVSHETHGLSPELNTCEHVTIPMNNIDSLNVAVAGGILLYALNTR